MSTRILKSVFDYKKLFERVPENQKKHLTAFVAKALKYEQRVHENPQFPPLIDWEYYKLKLPESIKVVEEFEKNYNALKVPYPDFNECELEEEISEVKCEIENFKNQSKEKIREYENRLSSIQAELPFYEMTMEEYCEKFTGGLQPLKNPTFWPHDYVENNETDSKHRH